MEGLYILLFLNFGLKEHKKSFAVIISDNGGGELCINLANNLIYRIRPETTKF